MWHMRLDSEGMRRPSARSPQTARQLQHAGRAGAGPHKPVAPAKAPTGLLLT